MKHVVLFFALFTILSTTSFAAGRKPLDITLGDTLPYADKDFGCISDADAENFIRDFGVDVQTFGGKELCNAAVDSKKLFNDLRIIKESQFEARGTHNFIKGLVARDTYYSWMKGETRGMQRGNDIPFATAYNSGGYFTMQDGWAKLSTLGRVGTVIHEARHTEGYRHFPCDHGPYKNSGVAGCDTSFAQGGSHAVEMEYYARVVVESKNLNPVYQNMARLMALGRSNHVFNQSPVVKHEAVAISSSSEMYLYDKGVLTKRELPNTDANWKLKRTSFGATFFSDRKAVAVDLYTNASTGVNLQDDYSYFKLLYMNRQNMPAGFFDAEEFDDANSFRYFVVMDQSGKLSSYNYPQGMWFPSSNALAGAAKLTQMAPNGQQGLFVVMNDGSILPYNTASRSVGQALNVRWDASVLGYAKDSNGALLMLGNDGKVLNANTKAAVPALEGHSFNAITNVPLYDAFEVVR